MDATRSEQITIARRFGGPPGSGNGGYTAGLLAAAFLRGRPTTPASGRPGADSPEAGGERQQDGAVQVTLRRPPPLDTALDASFSAGDPASYAAGDPAACDTGGSMTLHEGDLLVAEARAGALTADPVDAVSLADARDAETTYAGLTTHPFPRCFACGPDRDPGDGLRLRPGRISGDRTACTWTPDESLADPDDPGHVRPEFVWASLDCPGGWTGDIEGRPMVLGRITAEVDAPAEVGERHVVMGRLLRREGRKTFTTTTLYDSDGRVVARAEHVWIEVDPSAFSGPS